MRRMMAVVLLVCLFASSAVGQATYEVVGRNVEDTPNVTKVSIRIVVPTPTTRDSLDRLLRQLHATIAAERGFRYHASPTAVFIHAYPSREHSGPEWIGMLQRVGAGVPEVTIDDKRLAAAIHPQETRFGLSETARKRIAREVMRAAQRAGRDSRERYPDTPGPNFMATARKQQALQRQLERQYMDDLARRRKLSVTQLDEILAEGFQKNWPMPQQ